MFLRNLGARSHPRHERLRLLESCGCHRSLSVACPGPRERRCGALQGRQGAHRSDDFDLFAPQVRGEPPTLTTGEPPHPLFLCPFRPLPAPADTSMESRPPEKPFDTTPRSAPRTARASPSPAKCDTSTTMTSTFERLQEVAVPWETGRSSQHTMLAAAAATCCYRGSLR